MKRIIISVFVMLLMACSHEPPTPQALTAAVAEDGTAVAAALQARYDDARRDCGSASTPAFLCSGVLLRGTNESHDYHAWNPNPASTGGVSFSYLRTDANFDHLAVGLDNGFIFYPIFATPPAKLHIEVLCSYPIDGNTWVREVPGCGQSSYFPTVSRRCQSQGITTAAQWKAHFDTLPPNYNRETWVYSYVCSFDVRDQMNQLAADSFYQSLLAMRLVPAELKHHYNEVVLARWAQNIPAQLPIQAFFYTLPSGLRGAQHDQWDFDRSTSPRLFVPIIKINLPATSSGRATVEYRAADQYIQPHGRGA